MGREFLFIVFRQNAFKKPVPFVRLFKVYHMRGIFYNLKIFFSVRRDYQTTDAARLRGISYLLRRE